jgi:hypothetical protein
VSWADCNGASWNGVRSISGSFGPFGSFGSFGPFGQFDPNDPNDVIDDGRIGVPPIPRISQGIPAMTPTEMEEAIRNLQLQWHRIEEFLPNLATRRELYALRDDWSP